MNLNKILEDIGFKPQEARVYLTTLELGEATATEVSKKAKIKRSTAYELLNELIKKGYVSTYSRQKVARFAAQNPDILVQSTDNKVNSLKRALPEFEALLKISEKTEKPGIQYYEGLDGIIAVMEDSLKLGNKTICVWADINLAWNTLTNYYPEYTRKKNEKNIFVKAIFENSERAQLFKQKANTEKREVRIIPREKFDIHNEISIYDDKIAIISHEDKIGVIIQNQKIANTQRAIFELGWQTAGQIDK